MSPAPAIAPYVPAYINDAPYITVAEFLAWPTGTDVSQLIPGGDPAANLAALEALVRAASSHADTICHQVLAATDDVQTGEYRVFGDGTIRVPVDYTPLVAVTGVKVGTRPGSLTALDDLSGVWPTRKVARIPVATMLSTTRVNGPAASAASGRLLAVVDYVSGWPNTTLSTAATAAATSITPALVTGVYAGTRLRISDGASTELVTVADTYTPGDADVLLTAGLQFAHAAGVSVSALPPVIKEAVIWLTVAAIKTRGASAIAVSSVGGTPTKTQKMEPGGSTARTLAEKLLKQFGRTQP